MQYIFTYEDVPLNATGLKGAKNLKYWMGWPLLLLFASVSLQSQKRKYLLSVLRQLVYIYRLHRYVQFYRSWVLGDLFYAEEINKSIMSLHIFL